MTANFFDANFYRAANRDLAGFSDQQALSHFQTYGLQEGRAFSPFIELNFYRASNSDLASFNNSQLLNHAQTYGVKEGRKLSPFVDLDFYLAKNSDLSKAFGSDREKALQHLQTYGVKEDRKFSQFVNLDFYLANNSDVNKAFNGDVTKGLQHLEIYGVNENRKYSEFFDPSYYLSNNADVNKAFNGNQFQALKQFETYGLDEGRRSSVSYDVSFYRKFYSDLSSLSNKQAYNHFQIYGLGEGRRSSQAFDVSYYLNNNTDLKAAGFNNEKAIQHYQQYGQQEGRFGKKKVILMSLDGAAPWILDPYLANGTIKANEGLGLLKSLGVSARNVTVTPSLTAPGHVAIATGSLAVNNDINSNSFHLVNSPFTNSISGFAAPIGGYSPSIDGNPATESASPTAEPLWLQIRNAGLKVVTATFPGGDGADIRLTSSSTSPLLQSASKRTVDYTVPFGVFGGISATGFNLTASSFTDASSTITSQLTAAGQQSFSNVKVANLETITSVTGAGGPYNFQVAALDTTNDGKTNYDTLVFFDANQGIKSGTFTLPSTGPAYIKAGEGSKPFFLEGSANKIGGRFYATSFSPDLSTVHVAHSSFNYIPRNTPVLGNVDDINNNVGSWDAQADYRIPEKLSSGFTAFSDQELENIYEDQVRTFVDYQTKVALRAIAATPDADLAMIYIEQPDGSEHQFLITDPRQATDPTNPNSIGAGQDQAKIARYQGYIQTAYQAANSAVQNVINATGTDSSGKPKNDIIVVSDHGFDPFYTTVNMNQLLKDNGFDTTKVRAVTSGPAVNVYINLQGREPNGTVSRTEYLTLKQQVSNLLSTFLDPNPNYTSPNNTSTATSVNVFDKVFSRPVNQNDANFGLETSDFIGQDSGDVFALLRTGYNFDGLQTSTVNGVTQAGVVRKGDSASLTPVLSVPNFYGAHGYDPNIPDMNAIFYAAGPDVTKAANFPNVRNIDIAPTIEQLLGVKPAATVNGSPINLKG